LKWGSIIDSEDDSGRTALHVASLFNNKESVKILLFEIANPFKKTNKGDLPIDLTTNLLIQFLLERAKNLHIINKLHNPSTEKSRIQKGLKYFYDNADDFIAQVSSSPKKSDLNNFTLN
jgi:ankyrin repeat protein